MRKDLDDRGMYSDDAKLIADLIQKQWSLGQQNTPNVTYIPEQISVSARIGHIHVYQISRSNRIASTDYQTLERTSHLGVKISTRFREDHFAWCDEVYRILLANRRKGQRCLNGWLFIEIPSERHMTDLSGWYTTTLDVKLTTYNKRIESAGFGDTINKKIADQYINSNEGTS